MLQNIDFSNQLFLAWQNSVRGCDFERALPVTVIHNLQHAPSPLLPQDIRPAIPT